MPMKRFFAATDGTRGGNHAVTMGAALAQRAEGEFARLSVETALPGWEPSAERWREPAAPGGTATGIHGLPGIEIVRQAESWGADLVILGRRDHAPARPLQLGCTSDTVIRRRSGPTLFVPPGTTVINRVLIAVDHSLRGLSVLGPASEFIKLTGARAFAICVLPGSEPDTGDAPAWQDSRSERARAMVDRLRLATGPCDLMVRWGDPVREILEMIRLTGADLLVLGVRRGGAPGDLGSGHVGRDLLQTAPAAVLTVSI